MTNVILKKNTIHKKIKYSDFSKYKIINSQNMASCDTLKKDKYMKGAVSEMNIITTFST